VTNQVWQALVDAFRTQEVLIEGDVPNAAVLDYTAGARVGNPRIATFRGANQTAADLHSAAAVTARTAAEAPAPVAVDLQAVLTAGNQQLRVLMQQGIAARRVGANRPRAKKRNKTFETDMEARMKELDDELREAGQTVQNRRSDGWATATANDLQIVIAPILAGAQARFDAIQPPGAA
jgi:hypothetical protein